MDPGCLSRILIFVHPGSRTLDPKTATKEKGGKIVFFTFFSCHKYHKLKIILFLNRRRKIVGPVYKELQNFLPKKISIKLSKIWVWDPRSGIRKKPIPDPGSRLQESKGNRIPDPDPQHCSDMLILTS